MQDGGVFFTLEHKLLQNRKFLDSGETLHPVERPNNLLEVRSCIVAKVDAGDLATLDSKKFKLWQHMWFEGEVYLVVGLMPELDTLQVG